MELDLTGVEDGAMVIETRGVRRHDVARRDDARRVRAQGPRRAGLNALDTAAAAAPPAVRDDRHLSRRLHQERQSRPHRACSISTSAPRWRRRKPILAAAKGGKDPFKGKTGDFERHYLLAGRERGHAVSRLRAEGLRRHRKATPLVIALHGLGANEDSFFDQYSKLPPQLAEATRLPDGGAARLPRVMVSTARR